jgi:hypothetical protein
VVRGPRLVKIDFGILEMNGRPLPETDLSVSLAIESKYAPSRKRADQALGGRRLASFALTTGRELLARLHCRFQLAAFIAFADIACSTNLSRADEGGVGFWFPGLFGSLAAVPQVPGWALGIVNLYNPVSASGNVAAARRVTINNLPVNINVNR